MLALPKLNLQFLTLGDYLLRNFNLFRLEATYEIREDLSDVLKRIKPFIGDDEQARGRAGRARGWGGVGGRGRARRQPTPLLPRTAAGRLRRLGAHGAAGHQVCHRG